MKIKHLLASGCSFTQDGIGGMPPYENFCGASSFRNYEGIQVAECKSWASFLSKLLDVESFVNFASSSHGNVLISKTIIDALEKFSYDPLDTFVIFNISSLDRLDVICEWSSEDKSSFVPWDQNLLDYTFAKPRSEVWKAEFNKLSLDAIYMLSLNALNTLFEYLNNHGYNYIFTTLEDYTDLPLIQSNLNHMVTLDSTNGMYEYCNANNLLSTDNFHPSTEGHKQIAEHVYNFIKKMPAS